eukprot:Rhum_TRINITY_DN14604_c0_g1::Rhum_TRINITY_DN14604_c0_g1_i1::g.102869::m.102869
MIRNGLPVVFPLHTLNTRFSQHICSQDAVSLALLLARRRTRLLHHRHHLREVRRAQTSARVPALPGVPTGEVVAGSVVTYGDVVEHVRVLVEQGVHEPKRLAALGKAHLVQERHHTGERRRARRRATETEHVLSAANSEVLAKHRHVGRAATSLRERVELRQGHRLEVRRNRSRLVRRRSEVVAEAAARSELRRRLLLAARAVDPRRRPNSHRVRHRRRERRAHLVVGVRAASPVTAAKVAAGNHQRDAERHHLLHVRREPVRQLLLAEVDHLRPVADADHVRVRRQARHVGSEVQQVAAEVLAQHGVHPRFRVTRQ